MNLKRAYKYRELSPVALFDRFARERRILASRDYWKSLKNKHQGKRGFVIGNGPSLRLGDLERLNGEISIASNKIYLAFDQVSWRPTYYTVADRLLWRKIRREIGSYVGLIHVPEFIYGIPYGIRKKIHCWRFLVEGKSFDEYSGVAFSDDITKGAYGGATITFDNLQLAAHLGLNPIYIIGCDHYYAGESDIVHDHAVRVGEQSNHFISGYRRPGEKVNPAPIDKMNDAYSRAQTFAEERGLEIYNATRGGHLEAFPRVILDSLF